MLNITSSCVRSRGSGLFPSVQWFRSPSVSGGQPVPPHAPRGLRPGRLHGRVWCRPPVPVFRCPSQPITGGDWTDKIRLWQNFYYKDFPNVSPIFTVFAKFLFASSHLCPWSALTHLAGKRYQNGIKFFPHFWNFVPILLYVQVCHNQIVSNISPLLGRQVKL